jgi:hypothetical protein
LTRSPEAHCSGPRSAKTPSVRCSRAARSVPRRASYGAPAGDLGENPRSRLADREAGAGSRGPAGSAGSGSGSAGLREPFDLPRLSAHPARIRDGHGRQPQWTSRTVRPPRLGLRALSQPRIEPRLLADRVPAWVEPEHRGKSRKGTRRSFSIRSIASSSSPIRSHAGRRGVSAAPSHLMSVSRRVSLTPPTSKRQK